MMQTKTAIRLVISIAFCISFTVHGKPGLILSPSIGLIIHSALNANECSETAGCHNGYCWAWCGVSLSDGEWCYTSKNNYTQSHEYVECKEDSECNRCWKCGGPCALF